MLFINKHDFGAGMDRNLNAGSQTNLNAVSPFLGSGPDVGHNRAEAGVIQCIYTSGPQSFWAVPLACYLTPHDCRFNPLTGP